MFGPHTFKEVKEMKSMFESFDVDGSGTVDLEEFVNSPVFKSSHLAANSDGMFDMIDKDKSGDITVDELFAAFFRFASKRELQAMSQQVYMLCYSHFTRNSAYAFLFLKGKITSQG